MDPPFVFKCLLIPLAQFLFGRIEAQDKNVDLHRPAEGTEWHVANQRFEQAKPFHSTHSRTLARAQISTPGLSGSATLSAPCIPCGVSTPSGWDRPQPARASGRQSRCWPAACLQSANSCELHEACCMFVFW